MDDNTQWSVILPLPPFPPATSPSASPSTKNNHTIVLYHVFLQQLPIFTNY